MYQRLCIKTHQNVSESIKTHQNESEALRTCQMKSMPSEIDIILKYFSFTLPLNVGHSSRMV